MAFLVIKSAMTNTIIDSWISQCNSIEAQVALYGEANGSIGVSPNRSCQVKYIKFDQQRNLYTDILNNTFPFIDYHQPLFNNSLYRRLEIQHVTYYKDDHYVKHVDTIIGKQGLQVQRKISLVLMLSDSNEYSGGKLVIGDKIVDMEKGDMVMFRPSIPHAVEKVTDGIRQTMVMWAQGPDWR